MRGRVFARLLAFAGALALLAATRYMSITPTIVARIAGTAAFLLFCVGVAWVLLPTRRRLKARWMEYAIVGAASAIVGVAMWWTLGLVPVEAPVALPELTASPQEDGGEYYLVVENDGGRSVVWADVKIQSRNYFEGGSDQRVYQGYWEGSRNATTTLLRGQRDRLVVGGVKDTMPWLVGRPGDAPPPIDQHLSFSFYDPNANGRGDIDQLWARSKTPEPPKPYLFLEIILRTDPATPPLSGVYVLTVDGLFEHQPMSLASPK